MERQTTWPLPESAAFTTGWSSRLRMMLGGIGGAHRFHAGDSDDVRSAWFQYVVPTHVEDLLDLVRDDRVA